MIETYGESGRTLRALSNRQLIFSQWRQESSIKEANIEQESVCEIISNSRQLIAFWLCFCNVNSDGSMPEHTFFSGIFHTENNLDPDYKRMQHLSKEKKKIMKIYNYSVANGTTTFKNTDGLPKIYCNSQTLVYQNYTISVLYQQIQLNIVDQRDQGNIIRYFKASGLYIFINKERDIF